MGIHDSLVGDVRLQVTGEGETHTSTFSKKRDYRELPLL